MNREQEPEEFAIADSYFQEVRSWLPFRDSVEAWSIEQGSELAKDDSLTKPHQISHNIANAVVSSVDHLHALDSIMIGAAASHTLATFSMVRAAIECASQAAWISAPDESSARILRSVGLSLKTAKDREVAYGELNRQHPQPDVVLPNLQSDKGELQQLLESCGISQRLELPTSSGILREVRSLVPRTSVLSVWQLCSGFAHGRRWAWDAVLKSDKRVTFDDGAVAIENRPTMRLVVWTMTAAMDLTRYSISRFTELSRASS